MQFLVVDARLFPHNVVHYKTLVPREEYQDLYLAMRDKFKNIVDVWHEATDASKHVFEVGSSSTSLRVYSSRFFRKGHINSNFSDSSMETHLRCSCLCLTESTEYVGAMALLGETSRGIP